MAFPVLDAHPFAGARTFNGFDDIYLMSLIFMLSGLFVWPSLRRKGLTSYLRDRALRLGVPFLASAYLVSGLAYYASYLQAHPTGGNLADYLLHWQGPLQWMSGAAWFIGALLAYDLLAAVMLSQWPKLAQHLAALGALSSRPVRFFAVVVALSVLCYAPAAAIFGIYDWFNIGPFWIQQSRVLLYGFYFALGIGIGAAGLEKGFVLRAGPLARWWWAWVAAAILVFLVVGNVQGYSLRHQHDGELGWRLLMGLGWPVSCAASSFGVLAAFVRFARPSRVLDSLTANSYGIYLTHYAFVAWMQYALLTASLPSVLKAAIVILTAAAGSWLLTLALRRIPAVSRFI
jgi:peptidoglycan/LPS O-acetylase OafA/YrhL